MLIFTGNMPEFCAIYSIFKSAEHAKAKRGQCGCTASEADDRLIWKWNYLGKPGLDVWMQPPPAASDDKGIVVAHR
ncbi:MAG: hypothetical protein FWC58_07900 [Desulfobulbus sp.]|nr:hypothetical protein [Desulfobulbus sp.]